MTKLPRWIAFASFAAVFVLTMTGARAFTDTNAEMKEAAPERLAPVVVTGKAAPPVVRTAWVPASPKSLDGFKPVYPNEPVVVARHRPVLLAKAEAPAANTSKR
ncbi:MAG TPA: hypothetical protein VIN03_09185 [Roseateles sp.]